MLKALRHRALKRLWVGQALSSIGDEIYRVGLTWLAVGIIGADAGYLTAAQAASLMILSFIGGKWADNWDPLRTMIRVDSVRAWIVLIPVVCSFFMPVPLALLVGVAVVLSGLGAFFDPALQTILPKYSPDVPTLRAATGLMSTTIRLARMVGPGLVGLLAGFVPIIHFFSLDALSFFISAASLRPIQNMPVPTHHAPVPKRRISFQEALVAGFKLIGQSPGMRYVMLSRSCTACTWNLVFTLGIALLVQTLAPGDTRAFGLVVASYGAGNFAGALFFGNSERPKPARMMFIAYVWLGLGFIATACCPSIFWLVPTVAITGFAGPMNELPLLDLLQTRFNFNDISRIFRLRVANDTLATLLLMLIAPLLMKVLGVRLVIALCGAVWILMGTLGAVLVMRILDGA